MKKKAVFIIMAILLGSFFCGCEAKEKTDVNPDYKSETDAIITFTNEAQEADIWILPQTDENIKTSLWGTATIEKLKPAEQKTLSLDKLGGPGTYIVRVIDIDDTFYAANDIPLEANYSVRLKGGESYSDAVIEVVDESENMIYSQPAFEGTL